MHELSIAKGIIQVIEEGVPEKEGKRKGSKDKSQSGSAFLRGA